MKVLFILNDPPYGTERSFNGLRLAGSLAKAGQEIKVFLMGDAAVCAKAGQKLPNGYYNLEMMLKGIIRRGAEVGACGSCMEARGMAPDELMEGTKKSTLEELAEWTQWAEKVLVF